MRVRDTHDSHLFAQWLLDIGHGRTTSDENTSSSITIPQLMRSTSENDLIQRVYGDMINQPHIPPADFFHDRVILAPRNDDIRRLNNTILDSLYGEEKTYTSADSYTIDGPDVVVNQNIPVEFLHSLDASGLPVAHLRIKLGCPVILLRNIDKKRGLCNGTRAVITHMSNRLLQVRVLTGDHAGETALIPRITLTPSLTNVDFAIKLKRRQFPIQLAFAMTINKAQGQTLRHIRIDLRKPVFSHGQLYVVLSHATSSEHINVLLPDDAPAFSTPNVVFPEVLLD
jgi:ATP-dependent exoDNAse (exonuclease V) alpha subunit